MTTSTDHFRRHVNALGGIYYRLDSGTLTGRNSDGTESAMKWHFTQARRILSEACRNDSDPLPEYLDSALGARLADKWYGLERRYLGIKPLLTEQLSDQG